MILSLQKRPLKTGFESRRSQSRRGDGSREEGRENRQRDRGIKEAAVRAVASEMKVGDRAEVMSRGRETAGIGGRVREVGQNLEAWSLRNLSRVAKT